MYVRTMAVAVLLAIVASACGTAENDPINTDTNPTTTTTTTTTTVPPFTAHLDITIGREGAPNEFVATLICDAQETANGYLAARAVSACEFLRSSSEAQQLLLNGPPSDRVCTMIYGGSEVAVITGTLTGEPVEVSIGRADGCQISDWALLQPILVEPYDLDDRGIDACSAAGVRLPELPDQDLPEAVAALREDLFSAAAACDFESLAAIALRDDANISFGGPVEDPAEFWRAAEMRGATPMLDLALVLTLDPGLTEDGTIYAWPQAFLEDWRTLPEDQRSELTEVFGAEAVAEWDRFGGYFGYRVGISTEGLLAFFVAGD